MFQNETGPPLAEDRLRAICTISIKDHSNQPKVGIIILSWNREEDTRNCLNAVEALDYPNFQVYVVDNNSNDGSLELVRQREAEGRLMLISNSENRGYTGGNNQGMQAALQDDCDYLWLLNNDTLVDQQSLSHLIDRGESSAQLGLISPVIAYSDDPNWFIECGVRINWSRQLLELAKSPEEALQWQKESPKTFLLSGTALLVKRQTALDVGELDERFFAYSEDRDYCLRTIQKGYECAIDLNARVSHSRRGIAKKPYYLFYLCRNRYLFWTKYRPDSGLFIRTWRYLPYVSELLGWRGNDLKNRRAVFEGFFCGVRNWDGKWIPSNKVYLGICHCLAIVSLGLFHAKRLFGKLDQLNIRNRIRPWKFRNMRAKDFFITRTRNRIQLLRQPLPASSKKEVTVILPVRNRYNFRLANTLNSIKLQDYAPELTRTVLVDYGSDSEFSTPYREVCQRFGADYFRVDGPTKWSLSHATNLVIRQSSSEYILCTGMDLMLSPNFISEGIRLLNKRPRQIVVSTMFKSPEGLITDYLESPDMAAIREKSEQMYRHETWPHSMNPGVNMGLKAYYERIGGYDERFTLWGHEDDDFIKRMELSGLHIGNSSPRAYSVHQYHPRERLLEPEKFEHAFQNNRAILKNDHSIVRNVSGWGEIDKEYFG